MAPVAARLQQAARVELLAAPRVLRDLMAPQEVPAVQLEALAARRVELAVQFETPSLETT